MKGWVVWEHPEDVSEEEAYSICQPMSYRNARILEELSPPGYVRFITYEEWDGDSD